MTTRRPRPSCARPATALSNHQYEQAESIAQEVKGWNLSYGLFEDNPDKVAAAARALRQARQDSQHHRPSEQASQGVYDVLVQESRELLKKGKLDEAEAKARQAQRMNVVPALTADRAESVLHDIAMARSRTSHGRCRRPSPATEPPSVVAEHEANELLAKGDQTKADAKFAEAERLRSSRNRRPIAGRCRMPAVDPAVQRSSGDPAAPRCSPRPGRGPVRGQHAATAPRQPTDKPAAPDRPARPPTEPVSTGAGGRAQADAPPRRSRRPAQAAPLRPPSPSSSLRSRAAAPPSKGQQMLAEAKALYTSGNYPAARQLAEEAKAGKLGVDSQADELLAQIGLAEQGGALSLYESALSAMRNGDNARARALLTEVAAAGGSLDESLQAKVQELLKKLPADDRRPKGKAVVGDKSSGDPRRRGPGRPEAQRRGRHQDRRGPPAPGDRPRQGHRHLRADHEGREGVGPLAQPDAADGPPPRGRHRAGQEGQGRLRGQDAGQAAARPRSSSSGSASSRPTRPRRAG